MAPLSSFSTTLSAISSATERSCMAAQARNAFSTASAIFSLWNSTERPSRLMMVLTMPHPFSYLIPLQRLRFSASSYSRAER